MVPDNIIILLDGNATLLIKCDIVGI